MPRKKKNKNQLPSGNTRLKVYDHSELVYDSDGKPVIDEKTGKQKKRKVYVSITASSPDEARMAKSEFKLDKKSGRKTADMTVTQAIDKYVKTSDGVLSPTTIASYSSMQRFAFSDLMDVRLPKLTKEMLREAVNTESKRYSESRHKVISSKYLKNEWGLLTAVLNVYAPNVDTDITLPQVTMKQNELSTPETIYELVKGTDVELPVLLAMWLSFTMSEIQGLYKSKSISADGNYITINQVVVEVSSRPIEKSTAKQPKRKRTHRIPEHIKELIEKVEGDKIITMKSHAVASHWRKIVESSGIPYMTFHDLRHVSASVMSQLRINQKIAQERGGWSSPHVMETRYMQVFADDRVEADNIIDNYFNDVVLYQGRFSDIIEKDTEIIERLREMSVDDIRTVLMKATDREYGTFLEKVFHEVFHDNNAEVSKRS